MGSLYRLNPDPLDFHSVFANYDDLTRYAALSGQAYPGQILSLSATNKVYVINDDRTVTLLNGGGGEGDSGSTFTTVKDNSANWSSVYTSYNDASANLIRNVGSDSSQGNVCYYYNTGSGSSFTVCNLGVTDSPTFNNLSVTNNLSVCGNTLLGNEAGDTITIRGKASHPNATSSANAVTIGDVALYQGASKQLIVSDDILSLGDATVYGNLSARNVVYAGTGNSSDWQNTYTTVKTNSANWDSTYITVSTLSASWVEGEVVDLSEVSAASGKWNDTYTAVSPNSAKWNSTYSTVQDQSANWAANNVYAPGTGTGSIRPVQVCTAVTGCYSNIAGGWCNNVGGDYAAIVGGQYNNVNDDHSFIGAGYCNALNAHVMYSVIGGGAENQSSGNVTVIGGGANNVITCGGSYGGILGGQGNNLNHPNSFIIGSNLTSVSACTTHVNNLYSQCNLRTGFLAISSENPATVYLRTVDASGGFCCAGTITPNLVFHGGNRHKHIASVSTSNTVVNPIENPTNASALRTSLVGMTIPSIEDALDAMGYTINEILSALRSHGIVNRTTVLTMSATDQSNVEEEFAWTIINNGTSVCDTSTSASMPGQGTITQDFEVSRGESYTISVAPTRNTMDITGEAVCTCVCVPLL